MVLFSYLFFPQTVLVSSFRQKLSSAFSIAQCVSLTTITFIILNLNLFHVDKLIFGMEKSTHNKITLLSKRMNSYFFYTLMLKLKCIRKCKYCGILFI